MVSQSSRILTARWWSADLCTYVDPNKFERIRTARPLPSFLRLLALLAVISPVSADTFQAVRWVAPDGTDGDSCGTAPDSACQSISYTLELFPAAADMTSSATIRVAAGNYSVPSAGIDFVGRPVTIVGEAGAVVDCDGSPYGFVAKSNEPSTAVTHSKTGCDRADCLAVHAGTGRAGAAELHQP